MMTPTIHSNGTSQEALFNQYCNANLAIEAALDAMIAAAPHGRDYYLQGPDAFAQAQDEHTQAIKAINDLAKRYVALAKHCL